MTEIVVVVGRALADGQNGNDLPLLVNGVDHTPVIDAKPPRLNLFDFHIIGNLERTAVGWARFHAKIAHSTTNALAHMSRQRGLFIERRRLNP